MAFMKKISDLYWEKSISYFHIDYPFGGRHLRREKQMLEIHEVNTAKGFLGLRSCWNVLIARSKDNTPTLTWEHMAVSVKTSAQSFVHNL
jgi:hypothetical protein